jgi:lipoprotein NlpI
VNVDGRREAQRNDGILFAFVQGDLMSRAKWGLLILNAFATILWNFPAVASDCADSSGDTAIATCTERINSGKFRGQAQAINYYNRGYEYDEKQEYERAIADYSSAIKINPRYTKAFFNRGLAFDNNEDYDRAIADYNEAINLDPKDPETLNNRGLSFFHKGDYARATADYNQSIAMNPNYAKPYSNRGLIYDRTGDYARAITDYNQAIAIDPKYFRAVLSRGTANLYARSLDKALNDVTQASALKPKNAYAALWVDIVSQRNNIPSRLSQSSSQLDMTKWPAPIVRLFLGQLTPAAVLAAADDPNANKKKGRLCEANFYGGELSLMKGSKDEAIRLFRLAVSDCPHEFDEWPAANAELKALDVAP